MTDPGPVEGHGPVQPVHALAPVRKRRRKRRTAAGAASGTGRRERRPMPTEKTERTSRYVIFVYLLLYCFAYECLGNEMTRKLCRFFVFMLLSFRGLVTILAGIFRLAPKPTDITLTRLWFYS